MNDRTIKVRMFKGVVNRELQVNYIYMYRDPSNPNTQYPSLKSTQNGTIVVDHNYGLAISEGFDKQHVFIGNKLWNQFVSLLDKSIKIISENLLEIFPDINNTEFEINQRALERFQTEKACSTAGMTIVPAVWVDQSQQCYPAIQIKTLQDTCSIPLEDAIPLSNLLSHVDPISYGFQTIQMIVSMLK